MKDFNKSLDISNLEQTPHFWNNFHQVVIIIKIKVLFPQTYATFADFDYSVYALWFSCSLRRLRYLAFTYFAFILPYLMKVIPEMRCLL
jgi:hypothetical protein